MAETAIAVRFGRLVRELRKAQGLSQEEFAALCNLHRTYIGAIERGEKTVTIETVEKLSRALHISLSELFRRLEAIK